MHSDLTFADFSYRKTFTYECVVALVRIYEDHRILYSYWQYSIQISSDNAHGDDCMTDKGEILNLICSALKITEAESQACQGKPLLSTEGQLTGTWYFDLSNEYIQAVAGKPFSYSY